MLDFDKIDKEFLKDTGDLIVLVWHCITEFLTDKYSKDYKGLTARRVACAVTNEIFFSEKSPLLKDLYEQGIIEKEMNSLKRYDEIKLVYSYTILAKNIIDSHLLKIIPEEGITDRLSKAIELGIYIPLKFKYDDFITIAHKFTERYKGK
jgi:hypothetical protein